MAKKRRQTKAVFAHAFRTSLGKRTYSANNLIVMFFYFMKSVSILNNILIIGWKLY